MTPGKILVAVEDGVYLLKFIGDVRLTLSTTLDAYLKTMIEDPQFRSVVADLTQTDGIDSTSLGLLAKLSIMVKNKHNLQATIISTQPDISRLLQSMALDSVFFLVKDAIKSDRQLQELPMVCTDELSCQRNVIEAHKVLMGLSETNQARFQDLVATLESGV